MLRSLKISNFAVIERLQIGFQQGLNVLTGETGSGKSIIVDALGLLLGGRSSATQIRTGEAFAFVEGTFKVDAAAQGTVLNILQELEIAEEEELLVRRELSASGRSRIFINDRNVTAATLRRLQPSLVEIYGQGEQRSLLSAQSQLEMLDLFGGCLALRMSLSEAYSRLKSTEKSLRLLESEASEHARAGDFLRYQLAEIDAVMPASQEDAELLAEKNVLGHAEKIQQLSSTAYFDLYESDQSALTQLAAIRRRLEELSAIDARVEPLLESLLAGIASLADAADALRSYGASVESSPNRLAEVESRLAELEKLKRKYGSDLDGVLKIREELSERLNSAGDLTERLRALKAELAQGRLAYLEAARRLTACRAASIPELERRVMADLRHVALEQARFIISLQTAEPPAPEVTAEELSGAETGGRADSAFFTAHGADQAEFLLSANPGEGPRLLAQVASGGELSRLMLTLRTIGMDRESAGAGGKTVVFDEIDTGIGGRVAEAVGRRLKSLAASRQVLCVTHQAQIARFADHHLVVSKAVRNERTKTSVRELAGEERISELARMIGGDEQSSKTREAAQWLLESATAKALRRPRARRP
jgi:DNA repair protein RecN (Recombination protein N)